MKKLMFAALAVAGMSAFAADPELVLVDKVQISLKVLKANALESVKYKGFAFWNKGTGNEGLLADQPVFVLWDTKDKMTGEMTRVLPDKKGKETKVKNPFKGYIVDGKLSELAVATKNGKVVKAGQGVTFGTDLAGYGSGKRTMDDKAGATTDLLKILSGTIAGNIAGVDSKQYGTWKIAFDKSSSKLVLDKKYTMHDILFKNKVELVK